MLSAGTRSSLGSDVSDLCPETELVTLQAFIASRRVGLVVFGVVHNPASSQHSLPSTTKNPSMLLQLIPSIRLCEARFVWLPAKAMLDWPRLVDPKPCAISWHLMTCTAAQLLRPRVSLFVCWQSRNLHRGMQWLQRRLLQRLCWRLRWRPHGSMRWPGKPAPFGRRSRGLRMTRNAVSQAPQQHRSCSIPPLPLPVFTLSPVSSRSKGWCARCMLHRRLLFMPDPGLGSKEAGVLCRLVTRPFSPLLLLFLPRSVHAESGVHHLNARSLQLTSRFLHMPSSIRAFSISWHLMTFTAAQLLRPRVSLFVCWQSRNLHRGMQRLQRRLRSLLQRLCWKLHWRPHGSMRWPGKPAPFGRRSRGLRMTRNAVSQAPQQHRSCSIPPLPLPVFTLSPVSSRLTGWCARCMLHRRLLFMPDPGLGSKEAGVLCRLVTRPFAPLLLLFPPRSVHAESGVHRLNARSLQLTSRFLHMPSSIKAFSISWHLMTCTAAQLLRPRVSLFVCWQSRNVHRGMQRLQRRLRSLLQRLCCWLRWRLHGSMRWPGKPAPFGRRSRGLRMTHNAISRQAASKQGCCVDS